MASKWCKQRLKVSGEAEKPVTVVLIVSCDFTFISYFAIKETSSVKVGEKLVYQSIFCLPSLFLFFSPVVCQVKPRRWGDDKDQLLDIYRNSSTGHKHGWLQKGRNSFTCQGSFVERCSLIVFYFFIGYREERRESLSGRLHGRGGRGGSCRHSEEPRTVPIAKGATHPVVSHSPVNTQKHTPTHTRCPVDLLQLRLNSLSVEIWSINRFYCYSDESHCK